MNGIFPVWIALTCVSLFTRTLPLFASKWLEKRTWMKKIGDQLPCMIIVLMLFHDAESRYQNDGTFIALGVGLCTALLIHLWKKQTVFSIAAGVIAYTLALMV